MKSPFALVALSTSVIAAQPDTCEPTAPACYTTDSCSPSYCLGPAKAIANAPVRPFTCDGDWQIAISGFYWKPHMDGLEYAVRNSVRDTLNLSDGTRETNNLVKAEYESPHFDWDFGFKVGLAFNTTCDGWDLGATWTRFHGSGSSHVEAEEDDNQSLIFLWSAFLSVDTRDTAEDITTSWNPDIDLIDISLGRQAWHSPRFSLRPFIGLRIGLIDQNYAIMHKGGAFDFQNGVGVSGPAISNEVDMDLDFKGVGVRGGLDASWFWGCGFSLFGEVSPSIVYGRFDLNHNERNRLTAAPFSKQPILSAKDSFRASRAMLDLALGIKWFGLFCDCKYGIGASLAWEQHSFFHFNQFWRVKRNAPTILSTTIPNNSGENVFTQSRGTLSTGGWTLSIQFDF